MEKFYIGVDIGGTNTKICLIDNLGKILKEKNFKTLPEKGGDFYIDKLTKEIEDIIENFSGKIEGVGIGSAGQINNLGEVVSATNVYHLKGYNIKDILENRLNMVVKIINDVQAMALGELYFGNHDNMENSFCLAIGTGVGGGLIIDGKLARGKDGFAGEIGHTVLYPNGRKCLCGRQGCVEAYLSGNSIERLYEEKFNEKLASKEIFSSDDDKTNIVVQEYLLNLEHELVTLTNLLNPNGIIIGGGVSNSLKKYREHIEKNIRKRVLPANKNVDIVISNLGEKAMILGAISQLF